MATETLVSLSESPYRMQCMELWGGNRETARLVQMNGLTGYVYSRAFGQGDQGGDVYFFSSCASGRISRVLLADVTGHGAAVTKTSAILRSVMRNHVNVIGQQSVMSAMNHEFGELSDSGHFATAVLLTYFAPRQRLSVSIAGHPPPMLFRKDSGRWSIFGSTESGEVAGAPALPLGILDDSQYLPQSTVFKPGDRMLLYTDAFSEAVDADGQLLQTQGLCRLMEQAPKGSMPEIVRWLVDTVRGFHPENLQTDDCTAIVIEPTGRSIPVTDTLLAPIRLFRGVKEEVT